MAIRRHTDVIKVYIWEMSDDNKAILKIRFPAGLESFLGLRRAG